MVALEAMERARPVIAAEIGGLGELVRDGETGLLVAARRGRAAARGDRRLAGNLELAAQMGAGRPATARCATSSRSAASTGRRSSTASALDRRRRRAAGPLGHPRDRELGSAPAPGRPRPSRGPAPGRRAARARPRPARPASSGGTSRPVSPSTTISGAELTRVATTGFAASIASSSASPKPSQRAGWTSSSARRYHDGDVADAPRQVTRRRRRSRARSGPSPSTTSTARGSISRTCASARTATSTPFCSASRETHSRTRASSGQRHVRALPPGRRQAVEPVGDDLDLLRRQADRLDAVPPQRLRDRDHASRPPREQPLDVAERPAAERVVVVLGRHDRHGAGTEPAVDVSVHEMRVDDVRPQSRELPRTRRSSTGSMSRGHGSRTDSSPSSR